MMLLNELISDLKERNNGLDIELDFLSNYRKESYICDCITESADSNVDIYYSGLESWIHECSQSYQYLEDAVNEGLVDMKSYCFTDHVRMAQYLYYENQYYSNLEDCVLLFAYFYLRDEKNYTSITEQFNELLIDELYSIDNNNRIDDIIEAVNNLLEDDAESEVE